MKFLRVVEVHTDGAIFPTYIANETVAAVQDLHDDARTADGYNTQVRTISGDYFYSNVSAEALVSSLEIKDGGY
jgi:hypothetical protein